MESVPSLALAVREALPVQRTCHEGMHPWSREAGSAPTRTIAPRPVPGLCKCLREAFYLWGLETFACATSEYGSGVESWEHTHRTRTGQSKVPLVRSVRSYELSESA